MVELGCFKTTCIRLLPSLKGAIIQLYFFIEEGTSPPPRRLPWEADPNLGISPDLSAGTLAIPFTGSFLLVPAGISHRLFLKLPICSCSSWDGVMFCFFQPLLSVANFFVIRLVFFTEFLLWTPTSLLSLLNDSLANLFVS